MDISLPITYALAVLNSAISGILTEYYISKKNLYYIYGAIFCNIFLIFNYIKIFTIDGMGKGYFNIKITSIILVTIYSVVFFNEKLNGYSILGLIMGICSILLINHKQ
jgi:drug/metabolite transporter (DMT)-like permease